MLYELKLTADEILAINSWGFAGGNDHGRSFTRKFDELKNLVLGNNKIEAYDVFTTLVAEARNLADSDNWEDFEPYLKAAREAMKRCRR